MEEDKVPDICCPRCVPCLLGSANGKKIVLMNCIVVIKYNNCLFFLE